MKIFLDIGGHMGETLDDIITYNEFDIIHSFEPCLELYTKYLKKYENDKVKIHNFGLSDKTSKEIIYNPGSVGASVLKDKKAKKGYKLEEECQFIAAEEWFKKNLDKKDEIIVKFNCEGSEYFIIKNLIESNEYDKITFCMIWTDILKSQNLYTKFFDLDNMLKNKINYIYAFDYDLNDFIKDCPDYKKHKGKGQIGYWLYKKARYNNFNRNNMNILKWKKDKIIQSIYNRMNG